MTRVVLRFAAVATVLAFALVDAAVARAAPPTPPRVVPDYDGRGSEPTTPGEVALWVPRIIFSPIYFVTEFVLRRPLGAAISAAERAGLPQKLYNFFFFGPDHKAGVTPTIFAEFGFIPSVGIYAFWDDAGFKGNDFMLQGAVGWSGDWLAASAVERIRLDSKKTVTFHLSGVRRPDYAFFGIGPSSLFSSRSRYQEDLIEPGALIDYHLWRTSHIEAGTGVRTVSIGNGHFGSDPSLGLESSRGAVPLPYGFDRGYTAQYNHLAGALDSRHEPPKGAAVYAKPVSGSGVRIELDADQGSDVRRSPYGGWLRYGATVVGYGDLDGYGRVVSLSAAASFADPLGSSPIPFTELVTLGGESPMRGYIPGRLVGRSSLVATARYTWPIWVWLNGALEAATGNVFGEHLDDFKPSLLRFSSAIGIESIRTPDSAIEVLVGVGTETFEHGGQADSVRVLVGTNHGF